MTINFVEFVECRHKKINLKVEHDEMQPQAYLHFPASEIFALEHLSLIKKLVYQQLVLGRINYGMIEISIALL